MTPVGVFFICQNEDKCHFVNSTKLSRIIGAAPKRERPFAVQGGAHETESE